MQCRRPNLFDNLVNLYQHYKPSKRKIYITQISSDVLHRTIKGFLMIY